MAVRFCDEIEEFVSRESMLHWWNHGVHEKCLITYCFLVGCNIPEHLGQMQSTTLQTNIHGMLNGISSIHPKGMNAYFCSINSKLTAYKQSTLLELAIWKVKIVEQTDGAIYLLDANMKMACHIDSLSMVDIIVLNVLSFLNGDGNGGDNGDDNDGDDNDNINGSCWEDNDDGDENNDGNNVDDDNDYDNDDRGNGNAFEDDDDSDDSD
jgi:hypothetical protein